MSKFIDIDFTNCLAENIGKASGLSPEQLNQAAGNAEEAFTSVQQQLGSDWLRWSQLPQQIETAEKCSDLWKQRAESFDNFVVIGIGGSALGPTALKSALCHPFHNELPAAKRSGARFYVLDNVDPGRCSALLGMLDLSRTLFNVITKSGSTAETASQFLVARRAVEEAVGKSWPDHFIFTTDGEKGDLRILAGKEKIASLEVPDGVGGRFSVLSAVGLLPAAALGINTKELLAGAAEMQAGCQSSDWQKNPALALATILWLLDTKKEKHIHVMMPYSNALADFADWYKQLWAESLGKNLTLDGKTCSVGPTPVKALGATDQHSQVQLYVEGPADKVIIFISAGMPESELLIPRDYSDMAAFGYLGGRGIGELLEAERRGTEVALSEHGRPNMTISMDKIDAGTVGGLIFLWEMATAYAGVLYSVDAFNQPGVEAGKIAAFALFGRDGFEEERKRIEDSLGQQNRRTVC
jgi:glucose-6-phosphate isomerase